MEENWPPGRLKVVPVGHVLMSPCSPPTSCIVTTCTVTVCPTRGHAPAADAGVAGATSHRLATSTGNAAPALVNARTGFLPSRPGRWTVAWPPRPGEQRTDPHLMYRPQGPSS